MTFKTNSALRLCLFVCLVLTSSLLFAQKKITGRIISNTDKQPLTGATVQVKGGKAATQTAADGSFTIDAGDNSTLIISSVGFDKQEIPVAGRSTLGDIALSPSNSSLNEVVVTGYATQRKKDLTGAVSVVDLGAARKQPVPDVVDMLQGQASGVSVIGSGQPGQTPVIRIRGFNSFGNNTPLYVVDGVPTQNVSDLNTNVVKLLVNTGALQLTTLSSSLTTTLTNTGNLILTISSLTFANGSSSAFSQTNTCSGSIAPGGTCTITVTYSQAGPATDTLTINSNAASSTGVTIQLSHN